MASENFQVAQAQPVDEGEVAHRQPVPRWKRILCLAIFLICLVVGLVWQPLTVIAVVAGLGLALLVGVYVIKRWFRGLVKPFAGLVSALAEVKLEPVLRPKWQHPDAMTDWTDQLERLGYHTIGAFRAGGTVLLCGMMHPGQCAYGAIYDGALGTSIDLVTLYEDDSAVTYTTTPVAVTAHPPDMAVVRVPEVSAEDLHAQFLAGRPAKPAKPVSAERFALEVEAYARKLKSWQLAQYQQRDHLQKELREQFLARSGWSAIQWERSRDRVEFVHELMTTEDVAELFARVARDDNSFDAHRQHAREIAALHSPPEAFALLMEELPADVRPERVSHLGSPVPADAWLLPEDKREQSE